MQRECARYVNTLFAPQLANPPTTTPGQAPTVPWSSSRSEIPTRPGSSGTVAGGSVIAGTAGDGFGAGLPFDPDDVWPPVGEDVSSETNDTHDTTPTIEKQQVVDGVGIVELYASLKQGQSVKQWYSHHSRQLAYIDIRRFITFGIIKGFLYRVHKYAYATGFPAPSKHHHHQYLSYYNYHAQFPGMTSGLSSRGPGTGANSPYASSMGDHNTNTNNQNNNHENQQGTSAQSGNRSLEDAERDEDEEDFIDDKSLSRYLDGMHCFDQICTELGVSEKELMGRLKRYSGEVLVIHR